MRKSNPTKYQLARMQTAFILDDVDYVKKNLIPNLNKLMA